MGNCKRPSIEGKTDDNPVCTIQTCAGVYNINKYIYNIIIHIIDRITGQCRPRDHYHFVYCLFIYSLFACDIEKHIH